MPWVAIGCQVFFENLKGYQRKSGSEELSVVLGGVGVGGQLETRRALVLA